MRNKKGVKIAKEGTLIRRILNVFSTHREPLTSKDVCSLMDQPFNPQSVRAAVSEYYLKGHLTRTGFRNGESTYTLSDPSEITNHNQTENKPESQPQTITATAEDIVAAIFLQIEAQLEKIKKLEERNKLLEEESIQLRDMLKKEARKPLQLPGYITNALTVHGE